MEIIEGIKVPTYMESSFADLESKVINRGKCCLCGACIAFCPRIEVVDDVPQLVDYDALCGMCYTHCPRSFLDISAIEEGLFGETRTDELIGVNNGIFAARGNDPTLKKSVQDGGAVTALIKYTLDKGVLDAVVATGLSDDAPWKPVPVVLTDSSDVIKVAGSKYSLSPTIVGVKEAIDEGFEKIGVVGLPCNIQALRNIQVSKEPYQIGIEKVKLMIGLFCMENFRYDDLMTRFVKKVLKVNLEDVVKFEMREGSFWVTTGDTTYSVLIKELDKYAAEGCRYCRDFTAELSDISIGSVGSDHGWSTVIRRSEAGTRIFEDAIIDGYLEVANIAGTDLIKGLSRYKKEKAK
ncbi:coenzyme F420 hydrogenase [Methanosarcinales archaeon]|uniref:NADP oxidoreductase n=1 Tax=Candidatus Syntropharchaeum caldarium TaxID=1838285 RepID=A0A1F2PAK7_9EURY|nr:MAG: NADP oxidoreductase [Candidatus Syntrophoarchaeum caldarius]RLG34489.1 MAG: coenzyme F420 hydrogenase [Methanosarcinales archaeon]